MKFPIIHKDIQLQAAYFIVINIEHLLTAAF